MKHSHIVLTRGRVGATVAGYRIYVVACSTSKHWFTDFWRDPRSVGLDDIRSAPSSLTSMSTSASTISLPARQVPSGCEGSDSWAFRCHVRIEARICGTDVL